MIPTSDKGLDIFYVYGYVCVYLYMCVYLYVDIKVDRYNLDLNMTIEVKVRWVGLQPGQTGERIKR